MDLLFSMARPFYPFFRSGADLANYEYLAALTRRGFRCRVLGIKPAGVTHPSSLPVPEELPSETLCYSQDGLEVELLPTLQALLDRTVRCLTQPRPDWLLTGCAGFSGQHTFEKLQLEAARRAGVPAALLVHDRVETAQVFEGLHGLFHRFIANSRYIAGEVGRLWGVEAAVIYPVPRRDRTVVADGDHRGGYWTMFNPIQPKGVRTTLTLAGVHFKRQPFLLVEGWLSLEALGLKKGLFPNLRLQPRTDDVRTIYARTDCLLVPSVWQEPFGRVVLEGLQNGLPVAASAVGGIPEIMPDSPLLVREYEEIDAWVRALRRLEDPDEVAALRAYASERAALFDPDQEMDRLAEVLRTSS